MFYTWVPFAITHSFVRIDIPSGHPPGTLAIHGATADHTLFICSQYMTAVWQDIMRLVFHAMPSEDIANWGPQIQALLHISTKDKALSMAKVGWV